MAEAPPGGSEEKRGKKQNIGSGLHAFCKIPIWIGVFSTRREELL